MRIVNATTVKRATDDGYCELQDDVPLGTRYLVDLDSVEENALVYNLDAQVHHRKTIVNAQCPAGCWHWMPMELLKVDADG